MTGFETADLWYWKRPLYQLSHKHCPSLPNCLSETPKRGVLINYELNLHFKLHLCNLTGSQQFNCGSPGLVVMGGDSRPKVVGSNPGARYWMDTTFFHIDLL